MWNVINSTKNKAEEKKGVQNKPRGRKMSEIEKPG